MQDNIDYVAVDAICPNVYQPRKHFDEEAIEELAQSISAYGIIQPISIRRLADDRFELVAGERRLRAARKLGMEQVPAIIVDITDRDSAAIALLENLQREDLNFIEEAEAFNNLIKEHSYTQEKLAEVIGKKQSTIANKIRILKLSGEVRKIILENSLTERHARALLKLPDEKLQMKVLDAVVRKSLNVKATEALVQKYAPAEKQKEEEAADVKKKLKGVFSPKVYINTVRQVFDKFAPTAEYSSKEYDDKIQITITIPKV
ncbi:MAG: chromosome partitioning protein ParB [Firmicutes bacterium]|nr:chromosome partitioning protein ParB [Bacillota bacterium]